MALAMVANAQIPNYSFENWTNGANAAPDGWVDYGSNHPSFYPATQTADHYLGNYAVRIENKITLTDTTFGVIHTKRPHNAGGFGPAFPVSSRHMTLKGFYKYSPLNGDSAQIIVYLTKTGYTGPWGDMLGWGQEHLSAAATYIPFTVDYMDSLSTFYYTDNVLVPDSGYIEIGAYKMIGQSVYELPPLGNSVLWVDALNFDTFIYGVNELDITKGFSLFPNANDGNFVVNFGTAERDYTTIIIYDISGKKIMDLFSGMLDAGSHEFSYSLPDLESGNYLFVISSAKGYRAEKLCIQR